MAVDDWIELDRVPRERAGEWSDVRGLELRSRGVALATSRRVTAAPWGAVLGVTKLDDTLFVLVPRRPPAEPWLAITKRMARRANTTLDEIARSIEGRLGSAGYRDQTTRQLCSPAELLERLVARDPIPGTVEVRVGHGPARVRPGTIAMGMFGGGGGLAVYVGPAVDALLGLPGVGLATMTVLGAALGFGGAVLVSKPSFRTSDRRVLALAPDGCVAGLVGGVHAFAWAALGPFEIEKHPTPRGGRVSTDPHLVLRRRDGDRIGMIHFQWFTRPLELILAVAETYRRRFAR